jgi:hypothetical protein
MVKKIEKKEVAIDTPEGEKSPAVEKKSSKVSEVKITLTDRDTPSGQKDFIFSKEIHGDNFEDIASEFKETNKARVIEE